MLRPDMWIRYAGIRAQRQSSDFSQLVDGLLIGGRVIVGGNEQVASQLRSILVAKHSLGQIESIEAIKTRDLDPNVTYTMDFMAIAQLLMIAKNESFHAAVDGMIGLLQEVCVDQGKSVEEGLQILRENADKIGHL